MRKAYSVLRILLPVLALFLGAIKIFGLGMEVKTFRNFGTPDEFRIIFGILQATGGFIIIFPPLEMAGIIISIALLVLAALLMIINGMALLSAVPFTGILTIVFFAFSRKYKRA